MKAVSGCSTRRSTGRETNDSRLFRISAPGSSPASHRIWNPLQMPSTGPPAWAKACTAGMIGLNRAMAPERR